MNIYGQPLELDSLIYIAIIAILFYLNNWYWPRKCQRLRDLMKKVSLQLYDFKMRAMEIEGEYEREIAALREEVERWKAASRDKKSAGALDEILPLPPGASIEHGGRHGVNQK